MYFNFLEIFFLVCTGFGSYLIVMLKMHPKFAFGSLNVNVNISNFYLPERRSYYFAYTTLRFFSQFPESAQILPKGAHSRTDVIPKTMKRLYKNYWADITLPPPYVTAFYKLAYPYFPIVYVKNSVTEHIHS